MRPVVKVSSLAWGLLENEVTVPLLVVVVAMSALLEPMIKNNLVGYPPDRQALKAQKPNSPTVAIP
ncbi:hypothetical protein D3C80_1828840 [compost metagenome]